jgi:ABC-2 type transport system ATP-binding protein
MPVSWAIETRGLTRRFGAQTAVDGIDLHVPRGAVYGFLGPNGAGKTTTIRLLLGLLRPSSGSILLNGESITEGRPEMMRAVGALVETPSLYPHLTGYENLEVTRRMRDLPERCVPEALLFFGLAEDGDRPVRTYSLGMRQRLGLALAWLGRPELLLLDEPANGLDPAGIRELRERLRQLAREHNVTVFLSSHVLNEVEQVADLIGIVGRGRLLFEGRLNELQRYQAPLVAVTDRSKDAADLLASRGWRVLEASSDSVSVQISSEANAAEVNRCLLEHGIQVFRLERQQETLEDLFLRLVSNSQQAGVP